MSGEGIAAIITASAALVPVLVTQYKVLRELKKQNAQADAHAVENAVDRERVKTEIIAAVKGEPQA